MTATHQAMDHADTDNSRAALLADAKDFKHEVDKNYRAMFHENWLQSRGSFALFLRYVELFDKDKQFFNELIQFD